MAEDRDVFEIPIAFGQDGAPPHFCRPVEDGTYLDRWISSRGSLKKNGRSTELVPLNKDRLLKGVLT